MKRYVKDGVVKARSAIALRITRVVNGKEYQLQALNPSEEMLIAEGWVEYVEPIEEANEEFDKLAEIDSLKDALMSSDYKVIKCMEAYLCGEALPYDIEALHAERNAQRSEINRLEE